MADGKRSEQKEEHYQSLTESYQPTRTNKTVETTILEFTRKATHEPITRIISKQLDIKPGQFTQEELESVLRKIEKQQGLMKYPQKNGRHVAPTL